MKYDSHKTAIRRNKVSVPARWLRDNKKLAGRVLDYGCGWGYDAKALDLESYDPFYYPQKPRGKFDTIVCSYVLNVLPWYKQRDVLNDIRSLLRKHGKAYISVRSDVKEDHTTSRNTLQRDVRLRYPIVFRDSSCRMYLVENKI